MKKIKVLFILLVALVFLAGCQDPVKPIETEEPTIETPPTFDYTTLDGTYYLIMSSDTSTNRSKDMKIEEPFMSYEMTITGNELVETYHLGAGSSTHIYQIDISTDSFSASRAGATADMLTYSVPATSTYLPTNLLKTSF